MPDAILAPATLDVDGRRYTFHALPAFAGEALSRLPYVLRVLLESVLRHAPRHENAPAEAEALLAWNGTPTPSEVAFWPARTLLQDFTGIPALVDLAALRDALAERGGPAAAVDASQPVELVVDHSVQVDAFGSPQAAGENALRDYSRNEERYRFLKWAQGAVRNLRVVPPHAGIVHQVHLEHLARVVFSSEELPGGGDSLPSLWPDSCVGTDSHTPMVNALGVLAWGVGGIEAEAVLLGQPLRLQIPEVIGLKLVGKLPDTATATDLVLSVTERLRQRGVVGRFVEVFGPGVAELSAEDRATVANMAPEYGATCSFFPVDDRTLAYLRATGRPEAQVRRVEAYTRAQGLFRDEAAPDPLYTEVVELDLSAVEPCMAGPRRPQERTPLSQVPARFAAALPGLLPPDPAEGPVVVRVPGGPVVIDHGRVVIAALTSCTNTSNPDAMLAAGLLAARAVARGLTRAPWVKTSLAPGSRVVDAYLARAGLLPALEALGFHVVGHGCTTCIGNTGPLVQGVSEAARQGLVLNAVLSGNRNFEGRIHGDVRASWLASPPLVVAYAIAGRLDVDLTGAPLGHDPQGNPVYLKDLWPRRSEVEALAGRVLAPELFLRDRQDLEQGDARWQALGAPAGERFAWDAASTYIQRPPYVQAAATRWDPVVEARALVLLGDGVTTDHISPAGEIPLDSPAGAYLRARGVAPEAFNAYGARRGNHEVMMRGTFANRRLRNRMVRREGGWALHQPSGTEASVFEVAVRYAQEGVPLLVLAGKDYGAGSSRDWAAKGTRLLGVRAVIAESYERIHRANLAGMGVLPLRFAPGEGAQALGLDGSERYTLHLSEDRLAPGVWFDVSATRASGGTVGFRVRAALESMAEVGWIRSGGILPCALARLLHQEAPPEGAVPSVSSGTAPQPPQQVDDSSKASFPASDIPVYS